MIALAAAVLFASPTPVLTGVALHDSTVMQSMAWDGHVWVFAQLTQGGRRGLSGAQHKAAGDLTLTMITPGGTETGHMFLRGFGHGVSVAARRDAAGVLRLWTETRAGPDGYGTRIARFRWASGVTLSPADVTVYAPNPHGTTQTPSLSPASSLVAVRYVNADGVRRIALYRRADFLAHRYPALSRTTQPAATQPGGLTNQGWAVLPGNDAFALLTGDAYSTANPPPGNTLLTVFGTGGTVTSQEAVTAAAGLTHREPEGLTTGPGGKLCMGFASGPVGARLANVYCTTALSWG